MFSCDASHSTSRHLRQAVQPIMDLEPLEQRQLLSSAGINPNGILVVKGTERDDNIVVTLSADRKRVNVQINKEKLRTFDAARVKRVKIMGLGGNDMLNAAATDLFSMDGGAGDDTLIGGRGNDTLIGGDGNDSIRGGAGADLLFGDAGDDQIFGEAGNDTIDGGDGNDYLSGGDGDDIITGAAGKDTIFGDAGADQLFGDDGDDLIIGGADNDTISGGNGNDSIDGQAGNDSIAGDDGNDVVHGADGNDSISGGAGNDTLTGAAGADSIFGDDGHDMMNGGDTVRPANHRFDLGDLMEGGQGNDTILGNVGDDDLRGGPGNDLILGGEGNDIMNDGPGLDRMDGGSGFDIVTGALDNVREVLSWTFEQAKDLAGRVWTTAQFIVNRVSSALWSFGEKLLGWIPGIGSIFTRHPNTPPVRLGSKVFFALAVSNEGGSRASMNFTVPAGHAGNYTCYVLNVSDQDRARMQFQRKGDKRGWTDSNRGPVFGHGSTVRLDGNGNYLAERNFDAGDVLRRNPNATVLFLPQGMDLKTVLLALG